jgi:hypothetical protein
MSINRSDLTFLIFFNIAIFIFLFTVFRSAGMGVFDAVILTLIILIIAFLVYCGFSTKPKKGSGGYVKMIPVFCIECGEILQFMEVPSDWNIEYTYLRCARCLYKKYHG